MVDFELIYDSILERKCILVIGPELVVKKDQPDGFFELFVNNLKNEGTNVENLYNEDGFFHFADQQQKFRIQRNIVNFNKSYSDEFTVLFEKLAQIPFHLIFQVSSDLKLQKTYRDLGLKHKFLCYNAKSPTSQWKIREMDKEDTTLLISLLLDYDPDKETMNDAVLTYEDFISFIRYFYGDNSLPEDILIDIGKARVIIFLGYRFDKWYWNLVFDLFNFPNPGENRKVTKANFAILNQSPQIGFAGKNFYVRQYQSDFENLSIENFISSLYDKFLTKGKLKPIERIDELEITAESLALQVINHCKNSELVKAINRMNDFQNLKQFDTEYQTTIYTIIATYNQTRKWYAGRDKPEEYDKESGLPSKDVRDIREKIFQLMERIRSH